MKLNNNFEKKSKVKLIKKIPENYLRKLDSLDKELNNIIQQELDLVSNPISEASNNLSQVNEHLYNSRVKDIDVSINITLNIVSFSLSLLIAFLTIPQLNANWMMAMIPLVLSTFILVGILFYRRKIASKFNLIYIKGLTTNVRGLLDQAERHLDYVHKHHQYIKEQIQKIKEEVNKKRLNSR